MILMWDDSNFITVKTFFRFGEIVVKYFFNKSYSSFISIFFHYLPHFFFKKKASLVNLFGYYILKNFVTLKQKATSNQMSIFYLINFYRYLVMNFLTPLNLFVNECYSTSPMYHHSLVLTDTVLY